MTFWHQLYKAFLRCHGYTATIAGVLLSLLPFFVGKSHSIPLAIAAPIGLIILIIMVSLCELSRYLIHERFRLTPQIRQARQPPALYSSGKALLLLDPSPIFGSQTMFSLFHKEDSFEVLIGYGTIITVQENGLLQALVKNSFTPEQSNIWERIQNNDATILKQLLIKPGIPELAFTGE